MGAFIDLTGKKFGKLTVLSLSANKSASNSFVWSCICECGTSKKADSNSLCSGKTTRCSRAQCKPNFLNLLGKKFGKLEVIKITEGRSPSGLVIWLCKCDCGNHREVNSSSLSSNVVKDCGRYECTSRFNNLTQKNFGKLTVLRFLDKDEKGKGGIWECLCSCGNIIETYSEILISGSKKSCGCLRKDRQYETVRNEAYGSHLGGIRNRNIKGNRDNKITNFLSKEEYLHIASNECHYCGNIDIKKNRRTGVTIELNGIDRKNNEPYYKIENSLPCCGRCNEMKSNMLYGDFILKIRKMVEFTKNTNLDLMPKS